MLESNLLYNFFKLRGFIKWCFTDGAEVGDRLDHWDPFVELDLARIVEVDLDETRRACQLSENAAFALVATWSSNRTRMTGDGTIVELGSLRGTVRHCTRDDSPGQRSRRPIDSSDAACPSVPR